MASKRFGGVGIRQEETFPSPVRFSRVSASYGYMGCSPSLLQLYTP